MTVSYFIVNIENGKTVMTGPYFVVNSKKWEGQ